MNYFKKEEKVEDKRLIDLTVKEYLILSGNQQKSIIASSGILEKLEPIRTDKWVSRKQVAKEYDISLVTLD